MKASIIISTRNRKEQFERCITSVREHTQDVEYELIIIDAGSSDTTRMSIAANRYEEDFCIMYRKNVPGYSAANNMAMKMCHGEYIYLLNNDNWVTPRWLSNAIKTYEEHPEVGHLSSLILWPDDKVQSAGACITKDGASISIFEQRDGISVVNTGLINCDYAGFGLYRKDVLEKVGYLSEDYYPIYFDDPDYGLKVKERGYLVACDTSSVIYHECHPSERERFSDAYTRNHAIFIKKWRPFLEGRKTC
jgi:GT2 family glycosyltransferase